MNTNIKLVGVAAVAAIVVATAIVIHVGRGDGEQPTEPQGASATSGRKPYLVQKNAAASAVKYSQDESAKRPVRRRAGHATGVFSAAASDGIFRDSDGKPYPPSEQKIMSAAAAAIEHDDLEAARGLAAKALASGNKELREAVVDALGWFGASAMAELTPFMSDPDGDVAEAACSHWKDALQEIDDDGVKAGVIEISAKALKDKDMLEDVANELIGIDELAAIQVIVNVIEAGGAAADAVREVYDTITGEEWSDIDAAEAWLQENYDPDDDDDEENFEDQEVQDGQDGQEG